MIAPDEVYAADPVAAISAAREFVNAAGEVSPPFSVTIYDKLYTPQALVGDYVKASCKFSRIDLPTGQIDLQGLDPLAELFLACDTTTVPVVYQLDGGGRWSGRVVNAVDMIAEDGTQTVSSNLVGDLAVLDAMLAWPHPFLPLEIQPSECIYMGPLITVCKTLVAENALRLQSGINEFINELGSLDPDIRTWFETMIVNGPGSVENWKDWVTTPVCVIFGDVLKDTSPWINMHGRMDTCWKLIKEQLEDNGCYASMDLWLPGDPQPEGRLWDLTVPTYIFNVRDYSGVVGPTGTIVDGGVRDAVDLIDSLTGKALAPFLNPSNEYVPPGSNIEIAPTLGVNYVAPLVVWNADMQDSGIASLKVSHHHPLASSVMIGGKSPQWLSALLNATSEYALDMLMIGIGISGIPSDLLDGVLDNTFLAFQQFDNFDMRVALGPYGFREKFYPAQSTYNIDALFAGMAGMFNIQGYPAIQLEVWNNGPWKLFRDFFPGAQASVIRRSVLYTDYIEDAEVVDDRESRAKVKVTIGNGKRDEAPATMIQRKIVQLEENVNLMLLASPQ